MQLTVIIPVSSDIAIDSCLQSIHHSVEVIVILNNPSKEVSFIITSWQKKKTVFTLLVLTIPTNNVSQARNLGVAHASHNTVLFIDSDCTLDTKCLDYLIKDLKTHDVVKGNVIMGTRPQQILAEDYFTPNLGMTKKAFSQLGGFDEQIPYAEDLDLSQRINKSKLSRTHSAGTLFHPQLPLTRLIKGFFKLGIGYSLIDKKNKSRSCLSRCFDGLMPSSLFKIETPYAKLRRITTLPSRILGYFYGCLFYSYNPKIYIKS